jgi:hypothetical protein
MIRDFRWCSFGIAFAFLSAAMPRSMHAAAYSWNNASGGDFGTSANWTPFGTPGTANFGLNNTYQVHLGSGPVVDDLNVTAGNVTFVDNGSTLSTSIQSAGTHQVLLTNTNGNTSLTLKGTNIIAEKLSVQGGADLVTLSGGSVTVGTTPLGYTPSLASTINGTVIFDGNNSRLVTGESIFVAPRSVPIAVRQSVGTGGGTGELLLENNSTGSHCYGELLIADDGSSADGSVVLVSGSKLTQEGNIELGRNGSAGIPNALLEINSTNSALTQTDFTDESSVSPTSISVGSTGLGSATINIGAFADGGTLTTGTGGLTVYNTGIVNVGSETTNGALVVNGDVTINGGALYVATGSTFSLPASKTLTINGGTVAFKSYNPNGTNLSFVAGALSYSGNLLVGTGGLLGTNLTLNSSRQLTLTGTASVDPTRTLTLSGGTLHTGSFVNNGTLALNSGTFTTGAATLASSGTLAIGLSGTTRNTQYGALAATGAVSLAGTLVVSLNSFAPAVGNSFDILDWGNLSGTFSSLTLPALSAGRAWDTSHLYTTGVLSVVAAAGVAGDYNANGVVDAADYVAWRTNQGTTHVLPNDPIGGTIGTAQYNQWRAHFGQSAGSGSSMGATGSASAIPEPSTVTLLLLTALSIWTRHQNQRSSQRSCPR